jgi:hypothetical protein
MQPKKGLKVQHMSRGAKTEVLVTWGFLHPDGELLEGLPSTGTVNCSSAHLDCWWSYVQMGLLPPHLQGKVAWVSAELSSLCLHGLPGAEDEDFAVAEGRKQFLLQLHAAAELTLVPVCRDQHWALLVLRKGSAGLRVRWKDSLTKESAHCRTEGQQLLQLLEPTCSVLPERSNGALQLKGSAACGFYVAHWVEQEVRHLAGETLCSMGWPSGAAVQHKMAGLIKALQEEETKHFIELKKKEEKATLKTSKSAVGKMKSAASTTALKDLASMCAPAVVGEKKAKDMEDLLPEYQAAVLKVKHEGEGVCSKCRWRSGCLSCSWEKTLKHYLKVQFGQAGTASISCCMWWWRQQLGH